MFQFSELIIPELSKLLLFIFFGNFKVQNQIQLSLLNNNKPAFVTHFE